MKRNALWMSKIRCITHIHTHTHTYYCTTHHTLLSTSNYSHTPTHQTSWEALLWFPEMPRYTHTHNSHAHTHHSKQLGRKPVTLAFYQLICCCYRNGACWERWVVCVCVFAFDAGVASITRLGRRNPKSIFFPISSIISGGVLFCLIQRVIKVSSYFITL